MKRISALFFLAALAASSHAVVTSTFDSDAEGWSIVSYPATDYTVTPAGYSVTYNATGGNPGGYISTNDPDGGDFFFAAPSKFLGDVSSAYGTNLTYDLSNTGGGYNDVGTIVLKGGGLVATYHSTTVPSTSFTAFSIPLTEADWQMSTYGGSAVSQADFKTILGNLTALEIRGEYVNGGETAGLDNVNLQATPVPEPGSMAALGLGLVALVRRRNRR